MMDRERRAWVRFLIVVAAAALGETIGIWQRLPSSDLLLPLLFGAAAYYLTMGMDTPRHRRGGNVRYWRGRRIDDT
jgi:uncharacterized membrane protein AbrB (regulator of aidB expression)